MSAPHGPQAGEMLAPLSKLVTLEKMSRPLMALGNPLHTDPAFAREMGFAGPIAVGLMSCAYLSELLTRAFGAAWLAGGNLSVTFVKPVLAGDTVTARGRVRDRTPRPDGGADVTIELWCENQQGERTAVGEAALRVA